MYKESSIPYKIKSIMPFEKIDGYVMIIMTPLQSIEEKIPSLNDQNPIIIGGNIPPIIGQQMTMCIQPIKEFFQQQKPKKDDELRNIVYLENEVELIANDWRYGDIIQVSFFNSTRCKREEENK